MEGTMNLKESAASFSTDGLLRMHKALRVAFDTDEQTPVKEDKPCGVRIYCDWHQWSDALESVLLSVEFIRPVPW